MTASMRKRLSITSTSFAAVATANTVTFLLAMAQWADPSTLCLDHLLKPFDSVATALALT